MLKEIDHIGVAVKSAAQAAQALGTAFGFRTVETLVSPDGDFSTTIVSSGGVKLELIEPIAPAGGIAKFLEQRGQGIHHVSFRVDDIEEELLLLADGGIRLAQAEASSVGSSKVCFVHPRSAAGILIELIERE
jgi:methylmalonyl-CoA epimerase